MFILLIPLSILLIALIYFQSKYLVLIDSPHGQSHKSLYNKNTPLAGGIYLFLTLVISINLIQIDKYSILLSTFLFSILVLGIFSDLKRNFSPKLRLFLQFVIIFFFILFLNLKINRTGVFFLDIFIDNNLFNLFFTSICITIVINGSNFCDGVNCNVIGYYLIVITSILVSKLSYPTNFPNINILIIIFLLKMVKHYVFPYFYCLYDDEYYNFLIHLLNPILNLRHD